MEKYLYFRTQATIGDDDDAAQSACWPLSSFVGMHPTADDTLALHFKQQISVSGDSQAGSVVNTDKVVLTLASVNTHKEAMQGLVEAFANLTSFKGQSDEGSFIVVADDISTGTSYIIPEITAVSTILLSPTVS
tara:strand:- start:58 stop:459 length:402 start_codon:yes stop_codon:yes gene_type:complete